jgi:hypothetical protein
MGEVKRSVNRRLSSLSRGRASAARIERCHTTSGCLGVGPMVDKLWRQARQDRAGWPRYALASRAAIESFFRHSSLE